MSEQQEGPTVEGFGEYHPEAAAHPPYNDAMAAWRNQVKAMQRGGELPDTRAAQDDPQEAAGETGDATPDSDPQEGSQQRQEAAEGSQDGNVVHRTMAEALDLKEDGTPKEGNPPEDDQDSGDGPHEVFDPAEHTAPEVLEHLKGSGEEEAVRVLESEEAGKARKGILNLRDDILAKARENDETGSGSKSA